MPKKEHKNGGQNSRISTKIATVTGVVLALTALVTALVQFRDSIPWLTPVAKIELTPSSLDMDIGDRIQIAAAVMDSDGKALSKRVIWTSGNSQLVTVEGDGFVTAGQHTGSTTITAMVGPVKGVAQVHVRRIKVAMLEVFPPTMTMQVGDHLKFDATPYDNEGNPLLGRPVRWTSDNNAVASVDTSGDAFAKAIGSVKLTAASEGKSNHAPVTVDAKPVPEGGAATQPPPAASSPSAEPTRETPVTPARGAEIIRPNADAARLPAVLRRPAERVARPPVAESLVRAAKTMATARIAAQKITILGGVRTAECSANVRVLIGGTLVDLRSDPQEIPGLPPGDQNYNLHGTVVCPRQTVAVANGRGTINVANQKTYRCRWKRTGPKNFEVVLGTD